MNEANDNATTKRQTASSIPTGSPAPTTSLSPEDEAIAMRVLAEVGEERARRIGRSLATGRPGRKPKEPDRRHLMIRMAQLSLADPNATPHRLAKLVAASPAGIAECTRCSIDQDALQRWLRDDWKKHGAELKRAIAAAQQCPSSLNLRRLVETVELIGRRLQNSPIPDLLQKLVLAVSQANTERLPPILQPYLVLHDFIATRTALGGPVPPSLKSFLASRELTAIRLALAGPVPPGLQSFLVTLAAYQSRLEASYIEAAGQFSAALEKNSRD